MSANRSFPRVIVTRGDTLGALLAASSTSQRAGKTARMLDVLRRVEPRFSYAAREQAATVVDTTDRY
ncbi:MAG: hypothetical protein L0H79_15795 [Intrasporangium sp.]|uniref:hypothetical protein n=1 Tax=Intrasporangium sp. TaxID=1925024 RepID=UPI0026489416|nr:hypothetical protein [Intrasporangium sp.]MDN5797199.1 hypothetical protein [Intrasporangium sp.]